MDPVGVATMRPSARRLAASLPSTWIRNSIIRATRPFTTTASLSTGRPASISSPRSHPGVQHGAGLLGDEPALEIVLDHPRGLFGRVGGEEAQGPQVDAQQGRAPHAHVTGGGEQGAVPAQGQAKVRAAAPAPNRGSPLKASAGSPAASQALRILGWADHLPAPVQEGGTVSRRAWESQGDLDFATRTRVGRAMPLG